MRKILFRGKTPQGKWVYGGIQMDCERVWIDQPYLGETFVDKETVGQYTGLKDKNDNKIFEGDIVRKEIFDIKGNKFDFAKISYVEELAGFFIVNKKNKIVYELGMDNSNIEIIGNIYDNPELLNI